MSWGRRRGVSAMRRSSRWPGGRRDDSRPTARATGRTPVSSGLTAVPGGGGQLSEGLLVEASVVARLFRVRLLAIDASLVVVPAQVRGRSRPIGAGLAAAERLLGEGDASLAASRAVARRRSGEGGIRTLGRG